MDGLEKGKGKVRRRAGKEKGKQCERGRRRIVDRMRIRKDGRWEEKEGEENGCDRWGGGTGGRGRKSFYVFGEDAEIEIGEG